MEKILSMLILLMLCSSFALAEESTNQEAGFLAKIKEFFHSVYVFVFGEDPAEVPAETTLEEPAPPEQVEELPAEAETAPETDSLTGDVVAEVQPKSKTHFIELTEEGFSPDKLIIAAGDKVVWQNVRTGQINRAMVIGLRECSKIRSKFMSPGDSFTWTFAEPAKCTIVDGVMTTVESRIVVE